MIVDLGFFNGQIASVREQLDQSFARRRSRTGPAATLEKFERFYLAIAYADASEH